MRNIHNGRRRPLDSRTFRQHSALVALDFSSSCSKFHALEPASDRRFQSLAPRGSSTPAVTASDSARVSMTRRADSGPSPTESGCRLCLVTSSLRQNSYRISGIPPPRALDSSSLCMWVSASGPPFSVHALHRSEYDDAFYLRRVHTCMLLLIGAFVICSLLFSSVFSRSIRRSYFVVIDGRRKTF